MTRLASNFYAAPRGDPITHNRCTALVVAGHRPKSQPKSAIAHTGWRPVTAVVIDETEFTSNPEFPFQPLRHCQFIFNRSSPDSSCFFRSGPDAAQRHRESTLSTPATYHHLSGSFGFIIEVLPISHIPSCPIVHYVTLNSEFILITCVLCSLKERRSGNAARLERSVILQAKHQIVL